MEWEPISEVDVWELLNAAWLRMTVPQRNLWEAIRVDPEKWVQHPYGDLGGGFWAVGVLGRTVIWYNDIEDGFNRSLYTVYGTIGAYWCNQDDLEWAVQRLLDFVTTGEDGGGHASPPLAGEYVPIFSRPPNA